MGADLLIAYVSLKKASSPSEDAFKQPAKNVIRAIRQAADFSADETKEFDDYVHGESQQLSLKARKAEFIRAANDFIDCLGSRSVTVINVPERLILLAGGMSWGDSPTDSFDTIIKFSLLPRRLLKQAGID